MTISSTGGCGCAGGGRKKNGKGHTKKHMSHLKKLKSGKRVKTIKKSVKKSHK